MPFVAPTFSQTVPGPNGYGTVGDPAPSASDPAPVNPADIHNSNPGASEADKNKAVLSSLNRPDWIVVSKSAPDSSGSQRWVIAGPNGQNDTMIVGTGGKVIEPPAKTPEKPTTADTKPSPPDQWVTITDDKGSPIARQDPATKTIVDIRQPPTPAPRTDTPAETQNAATAARNADTSAANSTETVRRDQANEDRQARLDARALDVQQASNDLAKAKLAFDQKSKQLDEDLASKKLSLDEYTQQYQKAHAEASDAQAAYDGATARQKAEQDAQYQQGTLANQQTQTAEATRHNQATESETASNNQTNQQLNAATLLQKQQQQDQAAQDAAATRSETLLKDRATLATGVNNTLFNAASGAKNYGLGSSADVSGLPSASQAWATGMMGGQPLFDQAVKMVHDANPALSNTPQGAAYTSLLEQVLQKKAQVQAGGLTTPSNSDTAGTNTTAALAPAGQAGTVSPSDPRYLGAVIGHATSSALSNLQLSADSQFSVHPTPTTTTSLNNSQLSPDSQFTAPGAAV